MKIVDASAVVAVLFNEPQRPAIDARVAGERLCAPSLLPFEVANACAMHARRFPAQYGKDTDALVDFLNWDIELRQVDIVGAFALARRYGLTSYDASYLWLSREFGLELVTLDKDLLAAIQNP
jgi:predicted nucleic acid-binding protein